MQSIIWGVFLKSKGECKSPFDMTNWTDDLRSSVQYQNERCFIPLILSLFIFIPILLHAQPPQLFPEPLSARPANYEMEIKLDAEEKVISGQAKMTWKNTSTDTVSDLQLHMYLNAFKNTQSTFMREAGGNIFGKSFGDNIPASEWGWVEVTKAVTLAGDDLTERMRYIQPDDDNKDDETVLQIPLLKPVLPDSEVVINMTFTSKLPRVMIRTGYSLENFFLAVQWYPKLGVYEAEGVRHREEGGWNCHQYHPGSEYYGEFGNYDVAINAPKEFVVGATGVLWKKDELEDGTVTHHYHAEDVIDYAWTASPRYVEIVDKWKHVDITLLMQPEHLNQKDRYLTSVKHAFAFFDSLIGKYPYPNLTIVNPPIHAFRTGAMEYPTFITASTLRYLDDGLRLTEALTVHEFCHQYFMQMVSSNEMEEPWLDEGFTSYFEERILDVAYGKYRANIDVWGFGMGDHEDSRLSYTGMDNPHVMGILESPWRKPGGAAHTVNYFKASATLYTLQDIVGQEIMDELLRTYFNKWKFKHPDTKNFTELAKEVIYGHYGDKQPLDLDHFFQQTLEGTGICDYEVNSISNSQVAPHSGIQLTEEEAKAKYNSSVMLYRLGELDFPQEILVTFDNDSTTLVDWDGKSRFKEISFQTNTPIRSAHLDPNYKIHLDVNYHNNSMTLKPDPWPIRKYAVKLLFWLEQLMLVLGAWV